MKPSTKFSVALWVITIIFLCFGCSKEDEIINITPSTCSEAPIDQRMVDNTWNWLSQSSPQHQTTMDEDGVYWQVDTNQPYQVTYEFNPTLGLTKMVIDRFIDIPNCELAGTPHGFYIMSITNDSMIVHWDKTLESPQDFYIIDGPETVFFN